MLETETKINRFLLHYSQMLVADVGDEQLTRQPLPGVNHPAWILGHLANSTDVGATLLGEARSLPEQWDKLFGRGSQISPDRSVYPSKAELCTALEQGFSRLLNQANAAGAETLARPNPNPRLKEMLPTVGDALAFLMTGHFAAHLGQISAWRRMQGLAALF